MLIDNKCIVRLGEHSCEHGVTFPPVIVATEGSAGLMSDHSDSCNYYHDVC